MTAGHAEAGGEDARGSKKERKGARSVDPADRDDAHVPVSEEFE